MKTQPKPCRGINRASEFKGCGKTVNFRRFGLCGPCLHEFLTETEPGKIYMEKVKIKAVQNMERDHDRALKQAKKTNNAFKADLRQKLKTLTQYEAEAKKVFQKWVRMRDTGLPCISCGTQKAREWHGSHYFDANRFSGLIFNERNVHKSCDYCNKHLHGNLIEYRKGLISRYGEDFVVSLEAEADMNRNYKYTREELTDIKQKYLDKIKELLKC